MELQVLTTISALDQSLHCSQPLRAKALAKLPLGKLAVARRSSGSSIASLRPPLMEAVRALSVSQAAGEIALHELQVLGVPIILAVTAGIVLILFIGKALRSNRESSKLPPAVPGFPLLGNALEMTMAKPYHVFTRWSREYGPIYRIKTGQVNQVIVSSPEIAKEALVAKYSSSPNRDLPTCLIKLTRGKNIVAIHDYGERYRVLKRLVMNNLLGHLPQKSFRPIREQYLKRTIDALKMPSGSGRVINVRDHLNSFMFKTGLHQIFGREIEEVDVPELGEKVTVSKMLEILVQDVMKGAVEIDWRDFFPSLSWVPNPHAVKSVERKEYRRSVVTRALIEQQKKLLAQKNGKADCHCDVVIQNTAELTDDELLLAIWEPIIESSDTTVVTSEWTMYELAKHPELQDKLYNEIRQVAGDRMVSEDDLPELPYLNAAIKETLRKYTPVPTLPPRLIQEQVQLGGYTIPPGYQLIVNVYGIHHDDRRWKDPQVWDPSRMLGDNTLDMGISDMRLMPFGAGKRICAGITQTFYVVPLVVANLIQHFRWSISQRDAAEAVDTLYFTTQKLHPLRATATPRKAAALVGAVP